MRIEVLDAREVLGAGKVPAVELEGVLSPPASLLVRERPPKRYGSRT